MITGPNYFIEKFILKFSSKNLFNLLITYFTNSVFVFNILVTATFSGKITELQLTSEHAPEWNVAVKTSYLE